MTKIFISSTSRDLSKHRQAVIEALRTADAAPIAMEYFGSQSGDATTVSLEEVDKADLFIGIYAHRYGYRPDDDRSVTELEYLHAVKKDIPCLLFLVEDDYQDDLLDVHREQDEESITLLNMFKRKLQKTSVLLWFNTPEDLALKVTASYARWLTKHNNDHAGTSGGNTIINSKNVISGSKFGNVGDINIGDNNTR